MICRGARGESVTPSPPPRGLGDAASKSRGGTGGGGGLQGPGCRCHDAGSLRKDGYGGSGFLLLTSANTYL